MYYTYPMYTEDNLCKTLASCIIPQGSNTCCKVMLYIVYPLVVQQSAMSIFPFYSQYVNDTI